jgi:hypothetical protein
MGGDEARRRLAVIDLPDRTHARAPSVGRHKLTIDLIARPKACFLFFRHLMLLAVFAQGVGQHFPRVQRETKLPEELALLASYRWLAFSK